MTVTYIDDLLGLVQQALLQGATSAGANVFVPGDLPTWEGGYPLLICRAPRETKTAQGKGGINFDVTATIQIIGRCEASAQSGDLGSVVAEGDCWALARQVQVAVINEPNLTQRLSYFPSIDTQVRQSGEGEMHYAEFVMDIGMEFYQGWEAFHQPETSDIDEISVTADLVNVFDANGTYPGSEFPSAIQPAPRESGPDGRAEGGLLINLQQ